MMRNELLSSLGYDYRHRLKAREKSVQYYPAWPNGARMIRRAAWIEAAHYYGSKDEKGGGSLCAWPTFNDVTTWILMLDAR